MRHVHVLSPARVLHRVLLLRLANAISPKSNAISSSVPKLSHVHLSGQAALSAQCGRARAFSATASSAAAFVALMNEDIPYRWVRLADGSGSLSPPQRIDVVLENLPENHNLVMLAPPPEPEPRKDITNVEDGTQSGDGTQPGDGMQSEDGPNAENVIPPVIAPRIFQIPAAICRIVDPAIQAARDKRAAMEALWIKKHTKTLELNWGIASHDLGHRSKRLTEFLSKGLRVDVMLARKRGAKPPTPEQCEDLMNRLREIVATVPKAAETKKPDGRVGGTLKMSFAGPQGNLKKKKKKKYAGQFDTEEEEYEPDFGEEPEENNEENPVETTEEINMESPGEVTEETATETVEEIPTVTTEDSPEELDKER